MGRTLSTLAKKKLSSKIIFPTRFVVEICEKVHTHYRNIRLVNSLYDWVNIAEGFKDSLERWKKRGCPGTSPKNHIELCRKKVINEDEMDTVEVNLNKNLYNENKGSVYSEGVEFEEEEYIHLKIRDLRVELSIDDFKEIADVIAEAKTRLEDSNTSALLQTSRIH